MTLTAKAEEVLTERGLYLDGDTYEIVGAITQVSEYTFSATRRNRFSGELETATVSFAPNQAVQVAARPADAGESNIWNNLVAVA